MATATFGTGPPTLKQTMRVPPWSTNHDSRTRQNCTSVSAAGTYRRNVLIWITAGATAQPDRGPTDDGSRPRTGERDVTRRRLRRRAQKLQRLNRRRDRAVDAVLTDRRREDAAQQVLPRAAHRRRFPDLQQRLLA